MRPFACRWLPAVLLLTACATAPPPDLAALALPAATTQVLVSTTDDWDSSAATLRCFERDANGWHQVGEPIAAQVGRNGLGWGLGLAADRADAPPKREGDGKAPAGIFRLGPAFGYADAPPPQCHLPYRVATARDYFVDAADSPDYNQWRHIDDAEPNEPSRHWSSCERMRRDDDLYEFGVVVQHNMPSPIAGRGSAIFLHIWPGPQRPTSGCTAMSRADLLRLLRWLRPDAEPLLVQAPRALLPQLRCRDFR